MLFCRAEEFYIQKAIRVMAIGHFRKNNTCDICGNEMCPCKNYDEHAAVRRVNPLHVVCETCDNRNTKETSMFFSNKNKPKYRKGDFVLINRSKSMEISDIRECLVISMSESEPEKSMVDDNSYFTRKVYKVQQINSTDTFWVNEYEITCKV